ncbi:MAG: hypothetical protein ABIJ21_03195 [Nanoarchaeota archaeon]
MEEGTMIFDFFSKISKNSQERGAYLNAQPQQKPSPQPSPQPSQSLEEIRKKNIEQLRQSAINPRPVSVQSNYDTPSSRPAPTPPAFPNSRTEERGIPDSANPISQAHAGIPSSPPSFKRDEEKVDLSVFFNYRRNK